MLNNQDKQEDFIEKMEEKIESLKAENKELKFKIELENNKKRKISENVENK